MRQFILSHDIREPPPFKAQIQLLCPFFYRRRMRTNLLTEAWESHLSCEEVFFSPREVKLASTGWISVEVWAFFCFHIQISNTCSVLSHRKFSNVKDGHRSLVFFQTSHFTSFSCIDLLLCYSSVFPKWLWLSVSLFRNAGCLSGNQLCIMPHFSNNASIRFLLPACFFPGPKGVGDHL